MPRPRRTQISIEDTPYYHAWSRTVRRAFLTGVDDYTGKSYEHRREWIEEQILSLADIFAIDVAAYAVMSNHLHLVLRIDIESANNWSDREVVEQWHRCFNGTELSQKFAKGEVIEEHQVAKLKHLIATYRSRLCDISWFMRCLNEPIARKANIEDNCTKILTRLNISSDNWIKLTSEFGELFHGPVGNTQELTSFCEHLQKRRRHFAQCCKYLEDG